MLSAACNRLVPSSDHAHCACLHQSRLSLVLWYVWLECNSTAMPTNNSIHPLWLFLYPHHPLPRPCSVPGLSITAVGARRQLVLGVPGVEEDVGMLGIHLPDGTFLELVPWAGQVGGWNGCERVTSLSPTSTRPVWLTWGAVGLNCRLPADQGAWLSVSSCVHAWNTW